MSNLAQQMLDPYDRTARLTPAMLVVLPILVPLVSVYGPKQPTLTAVVALLTTCGALYTLASIARGQGKKFEQRLIKKWGGLPTTIALRHRNTFLDSITKRRYHTDIVTKLGIYVPTPTEEGADPAKADQAYMGATRRLRELTRGDKSLLLKENIAYGFHRNMRAMRLAGIVSSLLGITYALVVARALSLSPLSFSFVQIVRPSLAGGVSLAVSVTLLLAWSLYFNEDKVRRMGFTYAERLFEYLPSLPEDRQKTSTKILE